MTNHRLDTSDEKVYLFRLKLFNGTEHHILGKHMYEAMEKFHKHPQFDDRIMSVVQVAKVDL